MLNETRRALEDYDNQHDFERMAADILNGLGYSSVEPMAPGGGPDGGKDIKYKEGEVPGIAFVTLEKNIKSKFSRDLEKQINSEGIIAFFCNVNVSPSQKMAFTKDAISKGFRLEVFDLERLRSLLDSSLKEIRRRYLNIDDQITERLRSEVTKLLHFPDAIPDTSSPPTLIEKMLINKVPLRMFDLLMGFNEKDILESPEIGKTLHNHLKGYYRFRQNALQFENGLITKIGTLVQVSFRAGWIIYYKYIIMRFAGASQEEVVAGGNFLNYSITWNDAERVFSELSNDKTVNAAISGLFSLHSDLSNALKEHIW